MDKYLQTQQSLLKGRQLAAMQIAVAQHLAQPVRDLFPGTSRAEELESVRRDVLQISQAALHVAGRS